MNRVCRIGLHILVALGAAWMALGQDEVPPPAPPAWPQVAPVPPVPPAALADELEDLAEAPIVAPIPPLSPDVTETLARLPEILAEAEAARSQAADALKTWQLNGPGVLAGAEKLRDVAMLLALQTPPTPPTPPAAGHSSDRDDHYYERGKNDLDEARWEKGE